MTCQKVSSPRLICDVADSDGPRLPAEPIRDPGPHRGTRGWRTHRRVSRLVVGDGRSPRGPVQGVLPDQHKGRSTALGESCRPVRPCETSTAIQSDSSWSAPLIGHRQKRNTLYLQITPSATAKSFRDKFACVGCDIDRTSQASLVFPLCRPTLLLA